MTGLRLATLALATGVGALFVQWRAGPPWHWPWFLVATVFLVWLPGRGVVRGLGLRLEAIEELTLSLLVGAPIAGTTHWVLTRASLPPLLLWPLSLAIASGAGLRRRPAASTNGETSAPPPVTDGQGVLLATAVALVLLPLVLLPGAFANLALGPGGTLRVVRVPDLTVHVWLAQELTHAVPPSVPFVPGAPLVYHYGMDVLAAAYARAGGLNVLDLCARFLPTLWVGTTGLAVFCFGRDRLRSAGGAVLGLLLVFLGDDFSFVPGLLTGSHQPWLVQFSSAPSVVSLYLNNPMLPALGLFFGALLCLERHVVDGRGAWLVVAALLSATLAVVKVFVAVHLLLAIALVLPFTRGFRRRRPVMAMVAASAAAPVLLGLWWAGTESESIRLQAWPFIPRALDAVGLGGTTPALAVAQLFEGGRVTLLGLAGLFVILPVFLIANLGVGVLALRGLLGGSSGPDAERWVRFFTAAFVILGPLITLTATVVPSGVPPPHYNNAVWFFVQSKYLLWIALVVGLGPWWAGAGLFRRWAGVAVLACLTLPSTVQYFVSRVGSDVRRDLGVSELDVVRFFEDEAVPGDVVLSREETAQYLLPLTRCRGVALDLFGRTYAGAAALGRVARVRDGFWDAWSRGQVRRDLLDELGAAYVLIDKRVDPSESSLLALERRFENADYRVYRVVPATRDGAGA